jgi:hypothetical protein
MLARQRLLVQFMFRGSSQLRTRRGSRIKEAGDRSPGEREHRAEDARASSLKKARTGMKSDGSGIASDVADACYTG